VSDSGSTARASSGRRTAWERARDMIVHSWDSLDSFLIVRSDTVDGIPALFTPDMVMI